MKRESRVKLSRASTRFYRGRVVTKLALKCLANDEMRNGARFRPRKKVKR